MQSELTALETARAEVIKVKEKYQKRAEKERAKVNDVYVIIQGEKNYSEGDIMEWVASDYITSTQADKYIERLDKKKAQAGQKGAYTKSEQICRILENTINNYTMEIKDIKIRMEQEEKKQERWEIAKQQGCSYMEFLELEEISRQSEEYEVLMGIK